MKKKKKKSQSNITSKQHTYESGKVSGILRLGIRTTCSFSHFKRCVRHDEARKTNKVGGGAGGGSVGSRGKRRDHVEEVNEP